MDEDLENHARNERQHDAIAEQQRQAPTPKRSINRRQFLLIAASSSGAGAGLILWLNTVGKHGKADKGLSHGGATATPSGPTTSFAPSIWLRIDGDNSVTVWVAKSEMGQGVMTTLAMLIADELDADWATVRVQQAMADIQFGDQKTDGSASVSQSFSPLRAVGASARAILVAAAAQTWGVDPSTCRTAKGTVLHPPSGKSLAYGTLIQAARKIDLAKFVGVPLKSPDQFTLIGKPTARLDTPAKITGSAIYGLDVQVPGMRYATIARCPILGGNLASFDDNSARAIPGVLHVLQVAGGVAVIATNTWAAIRGRQALNVTWNPGPNVAVDSAQLHSQLVAEVERLASASTAVTGTTITATYETPFLAHATMEPMNCTAHVQAKRCEVWAPTQHPQVAQTVAATISGLAPDAVTIHVTFMGGGFGRRVETDFIAEAVAVSKAIGAPVKVIWTREDDLEHDFYRPASYHQLSASLTAQAMPNTWTHLVATLDTDRSDHITQPATDGADMPYAIAINQANGSQIASAVPAGIWRSSNYANTIFAVESFIDEIAAAGGGDPLHVRLQLLGHSPRLQNVAQLAASNAGWGTPLPKGQGRGMALYTYFAETAVAEVIEVVVGGDGSVRIHRVVCAVDCGLVVNPTIAEAQIEGGVVFGMTATLKGAITVANGQIQQHNFQDYPLLRMNEMPTIEVYFVPGTGNPKGLGELGVPPVAPAIANAIFAATGRRIRRLPIQAADLR